MIVEVWEGDMVGRRIRAVSADGRVFEAETKYKVYEKSGATVYEDTTEIEFKEQAEIVEIQLIDENGNVTVIRRLSEPVRVDAGKTMTINMNFYKNFYQIT